MEFLAHYSDMKSKPNIQAVKLGFQTKFAFLFTTFEKNKKLQLIQKKFWTTNDVH